MCSWKKKNNELQQPKTGGVLLHKSTDILQYQALGQAHGNILGWRESNPSLQHFINNFSFKMQEWEWAGRIRQKMEIWGRPDAPYQPAELILIILHHAIKFGEITCWRRVWRADIPQPYYEPRPVYTLFPPWKPSWWQYVEAKYCQHFTEKDLNSEAI